MIGNVWYLNVFCRILGNVCVAHHYDTPGEQASARRRLELEFVRSVVPHASRVGKWHVGDLQRRDDEPITFSISKNNPPTRLVILKHLSASAKTIRVRRNSTPKAIKVRDRCLESVQLTLDLRRLLRYWGTHRQGELLRRRQPSGDFPHQRRRLFQKLGYLWVGKHGASWLDVPAPGASRYARQWLQGWVRQHAECNDTIHTSELGINDLYPPPALQGLSRICSKGTLPLFL